MRYLSIYYIYELFIYLSIYRSIYLNLMYVILYILYILSVLSILILYELALVLSEFTCKRTK